ncbi:hypothetical protein H6F93_05245 [Leptolyngbya sp. FACHB-671]|uniref:hypothetical protein n=1 Tax=Leptolyngbya sp. FACHB-671 TaxID=2692812 RepID=UPI001684D2B3|nr:hypothetical protein [Leptolyngbya sp. FACHB-671]MBD2066942.1 hypothetical protein [Leptolyngbya sp. FACHB-671]
MSILASVISASLLLAVVAASSKEDNCDSSHIMPSLAALENQSVASERPQVQLFHRGSGRRDTAQCA